MINRPYKDIITHPDVENIPVGEPDYKEDIESVFVYGILQPGEGMWNYLSRKVISYIPDAYVRGYKLYATGYPWAVPARPANTVWGTLVFFNETDDKQVIHSIDNVEISAGYNRVRRNIWKPNGGTVEAWLYEYNGPIPGQGVNILNGDFLDWKHNQRDSELYR